MLETWSPTQKDNEQATPVNHEESDVVNNVSNNIPYNVDDYANADEVPILENYEVYVDFTPINDVVVSKKTAKKSKKKKGVLIAKRIPSKKTPTPAKIKKTPKKKEDTGKRINL